MTDDGIPRDPSAYRPTIHAQQQRRDRGIDWEKVGETIRSGTIEESPANACVVFVREFPRLQRPVGVVVDYVECDVITIEYRNP